MSDRNFSESEHQKSILRQLKVVIALLVLSNVVLGVFSFYFLRAVDRKYSQLISRAVPIMHQMQELTAVTTEVMRETNPALFGGSSENQREATERARAGLDRDKKLRDSLVQTDWDPTRDNEQDTLQNTGETFTKIGRNVIDLLGTGRITDATKLREESLRPAFERYVAATSEATGFVKALSLKTSDDFTERTHSISKMMLGLGSWPVMILGILLLITAVFIIAVLLKLSMRYFRLAFHSKSAMKR